MEQDAHPRVILYLGAGASYFAGYRTFVNFPDLLFNKTLRSSEGIPDLSVNSERILRAIRESLKRNSIATTHDNFLWRLDGYNQFLRLSHRDDVLQEFLKDNPKLGDLNLCTEQAIHQISTTTIHHYSSNRVEVAKQSNDIVFQNMGKVLSLYKEIANFNAPNATLPIFTTNYDLLLEDMVNEFGNQNGNQVFLKNGIPGNSKEMKIWNFREYAKQLQGVTLHLHRLHGCVCWFYHELGDSNIYFHRRDATQQPIDKLYAMYPGRETRVGIGPHGHSFRKFYQQLQTCDLVIFIGFSFRDDDVMHMLLKTLAERAGKLKMLVVDYIYTADDVKNKLEDASRRTTFPFRIPGDGEIDSLTMNFGTESDFDEKILMKCKALLDAHKKGE